ACGTKRTLCSCQATWPGSPHSDLPWQYYLIFNTVVNPIHLLYLLCTSTFVFRRDFDLPSSPERARIVLLAAGGMQDKQIAAKLKIMPEKAARWQPVSGRRVGGPGERCATTGKTLDNHAGQDPGSGPENDAREAQQCHTLEHAAWPKPLNLAKRVCAGSGISMA